MTVASSCTRSFGAGRSLGCRRDHPHLLLFGSGFENLFWGAQSACGGDRDGSRGAPAPRRIRRSRDRVGPRPRRAPDRRGHDVWVRPVHARPGRARRPARSTQTEMGRAAPDTRGAARGMIRTLDGAHRDLRKPVDGRNAVGASPVRRRWDGDGVRVRRGGGALVGPLLSLPSRRGSCIWPQTPFDPAPGDRLPAGDRRRIHDLWLCPVAAPGRCVALHRYAYLSGILAPIAAASLIGPPEVPVARRPLAIAAGRRHRRFLALNSNITLLVEGRQLYAELGLGPDTRLRRAPTTDRYRPACRVRPEPFCSSRRPTSSVRVIAECTNCDGRFHSRRVLSRLFWKAEKVDADRACREPAESGSWPYRGNCQP